ncbi:AAA family ATPase [Patescibacteria group bacterium]|nr:AAA family ATPase [Patescibacteria group bacterium]
MIIGITGTNGSGKDTLAKILVRRLNYPHFSLSDELREICHEKNILPSRENLTNLGNELRQEFGSDYLSLRILGKTKDNFIVTSIRNPKEIEPFKEIGKFVLISLTAPIETRYQRIVENKHRSGEKIGESKTSFTDFNAQENREMKGESFSQQLGQLMAIADINISNEGTIEELDNEVDKLIIKLGLKL